VLAFIPEDVGQHTVQCVLEAVPVDFLGMRDVNQFVQNCRQELSPRSAALGAFINEHEPMLSTVYPERIRGGEIRPADPDVWKGGSRASRGSMHGGRAAPARCAARGDCSRCASLYPPGARCRPPLASAFSLRVFSWPRLQSSRAQLAPYARALP